MVREGGSGSWEIDIVQGFSARTYCAFVLRLVLSGEVLCRIGGIHTFWPGPFVISFSVSVVFDASR